MSTSSVVKSGISAIRALTTGKISNRSVKALIVVVCTILVLIFGTKWRGELEAEKSTIDSANPNYNLRIGLLIYGTRSYLSKYQHSVALRTCYATLHGYVPIMHIIPDGSWDDNNWAKPALLLKHLNQYDWIFYFDLDVYIANSHIRLEHFIDEYRHIIVSDEQEAPLLAGMIGVKNSIKSESFLKLWLSLQPGWILDADNGAMIHAISLLLRNSSSSPSSSECLRHATFSEYHIFTSCFLNRLQSCCGSFGLRRHPIVRFLPPSIGWNKFSGHDLANRASLIKLHQVDKYRHFSTGDFAVHAKYSPSGWAAVYAQPECSRHWIVEAI